MHSLQGHFLVAAPHQLDPNFVQTVVLVVKHSDQGAFGLIINCRREPHDVMQWQNKARRRGFKKTEIYFGGPVTGPLMALHCHRLLGEIEILPGLFFSGIEENVFAVMRQRQSNCRIFVGYTGWGPQQLEYEIEQGVWRSIEATAERVFSASEDVWDELHYKAVEILFQGLFHLTNIPLDPLLN